MRERSVVVEQLPLVLLCAVALVVGLAWALATGPLNGPDESAHVAYVQHLAETGDGPHRDRGRRSYSSQLDGLLTEGMFRSMVGHSEGRPAWSALGTLNERLGALPKSARADGDGPNPLAQNPPLYYAYEAIAYRLMPSANPLDRLFSLRLANVVLFVLTVLLTWLLAAEFFTVIWPRVLMSGLVALQPKLGFLAGVVNADTLLTTVSTAFLLVAVRLVRRGPSPARLVTLGLITAAGPLTHGRGFFLLPAALLTLFVGLWPLRTQVRRSLGLLVAGGTTIMVGISIAFLWTRSHTGSGAFGGELSQAATQTFSIRQFLSYVWQFYLDRLSFMEPMLGPPYGYRQLYIETFFGSFGSLEVNYPLWVYDLLQLVAAVGLAALAAAVLLRWDVVRRNIRVVAVLVATFLSLVGLLHLAAYRDLQGNPHDPLITGRYLLPGIGLYALAATWTVHTLGRRLAPWLAAVLLAGSLLLTLAGVGLTAWRFGA